jgi:hypothetical protein
MQGKGCSEKSPGGEGLRTETTREEKTDSSGIRWRKVYTGGGAHFRHWLDQFKEIYAEENLSVEEEDPAGFACFEQSGEKMYSIWLKLREKES